MSSSSSSAGARREGLRASAATSSSRRSSSSDVSGRSNGQTLSGRRRSSAAASASSTPASSGSESGSGSAAAAPPPPPPPTTTTTTTPPKTTSGARPGVGASAGAGVGGAGAGAGTSGSGSGSVAGAGAPPSNGMGSGSQVASNGGQAPGARANESGRSNSSTEVAPGSSGGNSRGASGGNETAPTRGTKRARTGEAPGEGRQEGTETRSGTPAGGKDHPTEKQQQLVARDGDFDAKCCSAIWDALAETKYNDALRGKVSSTPASREKWNKYTHHAMVRILTSIWQDLDDRRTNEVLDVETDETISKFLQRVQDIGQEMTAFSMSNLQTHSLIDSTVQLCYRMASDPACRLSKGYPTDATSKDDVFDVETADSALSSESDSESNSSSDSDSDWAQGSYKGRAKGIVKGARLSEEGRRRRGMPATADTHSGEGMKAEGGAMPSSTSSSTRSSPPGSASATGPGAKASGGMDSSPSGSLPSSSSMSSSPLADSKGPGGGGGSAEASSSGLANPAESNGIPGSDVDVDKGGVNKGNGGGSGDGVDTVSQRRARRTSRGVTRADGTTVTSGANGWKRSVWGGKGKGKKVSSSKRGARKPSIDIRERFATAVARLAKNCEWAKERLGKPRKDVLVKAQETLMTIFVDSFYSQKLSEKRINLCLERLENAITWAEGLSDSGAAPPKYVLDWALRLSEVGLDHISLTAAE